MDPTNPFAPPTAPLDHPTPPPVRSPWAPLWWFPTALAATLAVFALGLAVFAAYMAVDQYRATGGNLDAGTPIVRRSLIVAPVALLASGALGLIAHSWHRRRWVRALILMALFYACGVATVLVARNH